MNFLDLAYCSAANWIDLWLEDGRSRINVRDFLISRVTGHDPYHHAINNKLAEIYHDLIPTDLWDTFIDDFTGLPLLAGDVIDLGRRRAWPRRRHLVAVWHQ